MKINRDSQGHPDDPPLFDCFRKTCLLVLVAVALRKLIRSNRA